MKPSQARLVLFEMHHTGYQTVTSDPNAELAAVRAGICDYLQYRWQYQIEDWPCGDPVSALEPYITPYIASLSINWVHQVEIIYLCVISTEVIMSWACEYQSVPDRPPGVVDRRYAPMAATQFGLVV